MGRPHSAGRRNLGVTSWLIHYYRYYVKGKGGEECRQGGFGKDWGGQVRGSVGGGIIRREKGWGRIVLAFLKRMPLREKSTTKQEVVKEPFVEERRRLRKGCAFEKSGDGENGGGEKP